MVSVGSKRLEFHLKAAREGKKKKMFCRKMEITVSKHEPGV